MGAGKRGRADRALRSPMRSPGRPPVGRREHRQRFWVAVARGSSSEDAGVAAGVSPAVGSCWFCEGGGMPTVSRAPLSGRYLSFAEREQIAILCAQDVGGRETARRLGRSASTISGELRRNAATRGGRLEDRATTAQWHADRRAERPKVAKLAANQRLRELCAAAAGGGDQAARRHSPVGAGGAVDRSAAWASPGPPVGDLVESGADRQPAGGRRPR
jgi:hypothetical protein